MNINLAKFIDGPLRNMLLALIAIGILLLVTSWTMGLIIAWDQKNKVAITAACEKWQAEHLYLRPYPYLDEKDK